MRISTSKKKIKVLETIRQGQVGGGESHLVSLIENLDREVFTPVVLSFTDGPMIDHLNKIGVKTFVIPTKKAFNFGIEGQIRKILEEEAIDLIHTHGTRAYTNIIWSARALKVPVVYTVHGWSFHNDQSFFTKQARILSEKLLVSQARQTISVSESDQLTGKKSFGNFESAVINNGIDLKKFDEGRSLKDIRAEYGIPKEVLLLGYILRITHQKNPLGMIEAFRQVLDQTKDVRLLMIGEGELKDRVVAKVQELNIAEYVYFDDFRQDVPDILKAIDVYCLPSLWEGLPIGLLEAMSMGKAVIATNVNGSREIVKHMESGLLIEPEDNAALADAILCLCRQPQLRDKLQTQAKNTIQERFDVVRMTRDVEDVYRQIAKK